MWHAITHLRNYTNLARSDRSIVNGNLSLWICIEPEMFSIKLKEFPNVIFTNGVSHSRVLVPIAYIRHLYWSWSIRSWLVIEQGSPSVIRFTDLIRPTCTNSRPLIVSPKHKSYWIQYQSSPFSYRQSPYAKPHYKGRWITNIAR